MDRFARLWRAFDHGFLWPVSNWLWANIVNPLLASLRQITPRTFFRVVVFLLVVWTAAAVFPPDLAVMFAGDTTLYFEIFSFAYLAIVRGQAHRAVKPTIQMLCTLARRGGQGIVRAVARTRRTPRRPRLFDSEDSGDVPDGAFVPA